MKYQATVLTHKGLVREHNEDNYLLDTERALFFVADGMGGHDCGEVASQIAVDSLQGYYALPELLERHEQSFLNALHEHMDEGELSLHSWLLRKAVLAANEAIFSDASVVKQRAHMGTTLVGLRFVGHRAYAAHVGDSRAYRFRDGLLTQLTSDHSLANQYVAQGLLKREDVPYFPYKNIIVRALGLDPTVQVDIAPWTVLPGDRYLLCSDGLSDLLTNQELADAFASTSERDELAEELVDMALEEGGLDNVTVLLVDVVDEEVGEAANAVGEGKAPLALAPSLQEASS